MLFQMAPQNSTLLHENGELCVDLSHYSPILKATFNDMLETCSSTSGTTDTDENIHPRKSIAKFDRVNYEQVENEIPIWICGKPRFVSGITNSTTCSDLIQALIDDELNNNKADVTASRDLNDYVISEKWRDVEQALPGDTKILPIWLAWGSIQYEVKFKLKINKNKAGTNIAGDYNNDNGDANHHDKRYKQEERCKRSAGVEQLMKRLMYQGESIKQQLNILREKNSTGHNRMSSKCKGSKKYPKSLFDSFLHDSLQLNANQNDAHEPRNCTVSPKVVAQIKQKQLDPIGTTSPISNDELFLMIDDGTINNDVHVEYRQYYLNKKLDSAMAAAKVSGNNANAIPTKRKSIPRKLEFDAARQNCHNKRLIKHLCENINRQQLRNRCTTLKSAHHDKQSSVHREIDKLMRELQQLTTDEEELMKKLSIKCDRYRNQNNKYMTNLRLKLCIDEVQHNLDVYAKEIIENELDLHRIQTEIQQKYDNLFDLGIKIESKNAEAHDSDHTINTTATGNKSFII